MNIAKLHDICPEDWELSRINKACKIHNHLRKPINVDDRKAMQGEYPYFGPTGILDFINEYRAEGKFTLIGEDGDHFLKFKDKNMTLLVEGKFNVNNHAHILTGKKGCSTEWVYNFYRHTSIYPYLTRQGAGRYKLNKEALNTIPIMFPPLPEQEKIAEILGCWDSGIEWLEKLIATKQKMKKALMQQLLTGKKRFKEFKGQEWKEYHLGEIFKHRVERGNINLPLLAITGADGVVMRDGLERRDTSSEDKSKYLRICPGDIGYNTMRMWQGVSGVSEYEGIVSPAYTICIPDKEKIAPIFIGYLFKFHPVVFMFYRYSQGLVSDTWNLKFHHFAEIKITIPGLGEQQKIAAVLGAADKEIEILQKKLDELKNQKKGLMQKLLTGKIRVKV